MTANGTSLAMATASSARAHVWTQHEPMSWPTFVAWLELDNPADHKDCGGYVVGELQVTTGCSRSLSCTALHRNKRAVVSRSAIALDADNATPSFFADAAAELGCALACYTTWSHTPDAPRWRLLAPLSRSVTPDEYRSIVLAVMATLGYEQFDRGSAEPERLMYRPSGNGHYTPHVVDGPPLDAESWLDRAEELGVTVRTVDRPRHHDDGPERTESGLHPYAAAAIAEELARLDALTLPWAQGDHWDQTTFAVACNLREFANSRWSGYTLEQAEADLYEHAPRDDVWGAPQHAAKWASAEATVRDGARPYPGGSAADDFAALVEKSNENSAILSRFPRTSLSALLDPNRPEREYVVEPLITAGTSTALVAPAGHRKSLLALGLALAVARGDSEFAGMTIPRPRRVLYVDMENTEDDLRERLLSFGVAPRDDLERLVLLSLLPAMKPLDSAQGGTEFLEAVRAYGLAAGDVVVLDSYQRVTEAGENDSDTTRSFYRHTGVRLKQSGLTVIRTDNTGKDVSRGARGSSGKRDDVDVEYLLQSDGDYIDIATGKVRLRGVSRMSIYVSTDENGRTTFRSDLPTPTARKAAACVETLDRLGLASDASERKALDVLKAAGDTTPRKVVREAVALRKARVEDFDGG